MGDTDQSRERPEFELDLIEDPRSAAQLGITHCLSTLNSYI